MEKKRFNTRFRELYDLSGCTSITQFAKVLGMNRQSVDRYYNNQRLPDAPALTQICEKMNVSADWLLGLSDVKSTSPDIQTCIKTIGLSEKAVEKLTQTKPFRDLSGFSPADYMLTDGQYRLTDEGKRKIKGIKPTVSIMVSSLSRLIESKGFSRLIFDYRTFLNSTEELKTSSLEQPQNRMIGENVVLSCDEAVRYHMQNTANDMLSICDEEYRKQLAVAIANEKKRLESESEKEDEIENGDE